MEKQKKTFKAIVRDIETNDGYEAEIQAVSEEAAIKELKEWYALELGTDEDQVSVEIKKQDANPA